MDTTTDDTKTAPQASAWSRFRDWLGWKIAVFGLVISTPAFQLSIKELLALGLTTKIKEALAEQGHTPESLLQGLLDAVKAEAEESD